MSTKTRRARAAGTAVVALLATLLLGTPASALPRDVERARPGCTTEECFTVDVILARPPTVGQTTTLTVDVESAVTRPRATIRVTLPKNLAWVTVPPGLTTSGQGVALTERAVSTGQHLRYAGSVRATAEGPAEIVVTAVADSPRGPVERGSGQAFATIGREKSTMDIAVAAQPVATTPAAEPRRSAFPPGPGIAAVTACATGFVSYLDNFNITLPSPNQSVRVFDRDSSGDDFLAVGATDASGHFTVCFDNDDDDSSVGQDVYVTVSTDNTRWKVHDAAGNAYSIRRDGPDNVANNSTTNLGTLQPTSSLHRAWHAFDEVNQAWNFVPHGNGNCWDANDTVCHPQILLRWTPTSTDGEFFCPVVGSGAPGQCPVANTVHLKFNAPDAHTVLHELGHAVMWDVYEHQGPFSSDCTGHRMDVALTPECAWLEGFADWFALAVTGAFGYVFEDGTFVNLEDLSSVSWDLGDAVQGRISSSLLDIADGVNAGVSVAEAWDEYTEGPMKIYSTFLNHVSMNLAQFWAQRGQDGFNVASNGALANLFGNTIDYGFRPVLSSQVALRRPIPLLPTHYVVSPTRAFWSVVAVTPETRDYDLQVHPPNGQFASSTFGFDADFPTTDFVAINGNLQSFGSCDAMVYAPGPRAAVVAPYTVEFYDGDTTISGTGTVTLAAGQNVLVRDVIVGEGDAITVQVAPTKPGQYPQVFLMSSNPSDPSTLLRSRGAAAAQGLTTSPSKVATTPAFTAPLTAWYGIVIVNKNPMVGGDYTVTVTIT